MNRVTASQPQAVAVLRDKLEALYQADVKSSSEDEMSQLQKEGADLWVELMKAKETRNPPREEATAESEEKGSLHGWSLVEKQNSDSLQSGIDMEERSVLSVRDMLLTCLFCCKICCWTFPRATFFLLVNCSCSRLYVLVSFGKFVMIHKST